MLLVPGSDDPSCIILATSPEEAASLLKGEFRGRVKDGEIWEIAFPISLFDPPVLGSRDEQWKDGMWSYYIEATLGQRIELLLDLSNETEFVMWLVECSVVSSVPLLDKS